MGSAPSVASTPTSAVIPTITPPPPVAAPLPPAAVPVPTPPPYQWPSPASSDPAAAITNSLNSAIASIKEQQQKLLAPGTLVLKPAQHGFFHKLIFGNFKYKLLTTILLCGGAYALIKYLQRESELEDELRDVEVKFKDDEKESEITYLEMDERSLCRRLVAKLWIPSVVESGKHGIFDSMQTTKEIEDSANANKAWHYSEIDTGILTGQVTASRSRAAETTMPDELRFLTKATKILGHFDKKSTMATWKNIDSVELNKGDYLFRTGDPDIYVYIVLGGCIQVIVNDQEALSRQKFKTPYLVLKRFHAGDHIYSTLSFLECICGHPSNYSSVEALAVEDSVVLKLPVEDFRLNWFERPVQMKAAVCRLMRRIYQVVFVAMHRVIGLSVEVTNQIARKPLDPAYVADQSTKVSPELRGKILAAARKYFEMEQPEYDEYFNKCATLILPKGANPARAGTRSIKMVFVYEGELEISSNMEFSELELMEMRAEKAEVENIEEILYYVPAKEAVGGLSYLTGGVNIFNVRVPEKATLCIMPEEVLLKQIDFGLEWTFVESGEDLFKIGDEPEHTYLVLSGRLRSFVPDEKGKLKMLSEYGKDDWVGLVETLSKKKRSKTVVAVRDTELAKIPHGVLHLIKLKYPVVTMRLLDFVGARVAKGKGYNVHITNQATDVSIPTPLEGPRGCSTITLVPVSDQVPMLCVAYELQLAYSQRYGQAGIVTHANLIESLGPEALAKANDYLLTNWLSTQEERWALVIYVAEPEPNRWTMKCVRQADIIYILVNTLTDTFEVSPVELMINKEAPTAKKELMLLHRLYSTVPNAPERVYPQDSKAWIQRRPWLTFHHHVGLREKACHFLDTDFAKVEKYYLTEAEKVADIYSDYSRLSRWVSGNAVGLVLGGGGAKGAAHLGIIRVMREHKIPIDMISGVSIGSFVGGLYALHQDIDMVEKVAHVWFENIGSPWKGIFDLTVPFTAVLKGESFNFAVRQAFGEVQIEDLWLPYFCLSTNITANCSRVHRSGMLWRYSRASMTLAMLNPPMCDPIDGHYLMDGGYTNLVPANVMRQIGAKFILAVDVSSEDEKISTNYGDSLSGMKILLHKILPFTKPLLVPTYFGVIQQLSFVQSALYLEIIKKMDRQSIYIRPPLDHFTSTDFLDYRGILLVGYDFAKKLMRNVEEDDSLPVIWQKMFTNLPSVEAKPQMQGSKERPDPRSQDPQSRCQRKKVRFEFLKVDSKVV